MKLLLIVVMYGFLMTSFSTEGKESLSAGDSEVSSNKGKESSSVANSEAPSIDGKESSSVAEREPQSVGRKRRNKMAAFVQIRRAMNRASAGLHDEATRMLFPLLFNPILKKRHNEIRYRLALSFYNMKLYHPAIFQFQRLIDKKAKGYVGKSLQKIALAAAVLKEDQFLNYAISKGSLRYISRSERQSLHYHFGEYWMRKKRFRKAISHFSRVKSTNPFFYKALYQMGLAHAEIGHINKAIQIFHNLENRRSGVTDNIRVAAIMGKARVYYQGKKWDQSVENYHKVPKDSPFWYDILLEKSWALLRGGRFRSTLSHFHTLHSPYYEGYYQPESLLLRSIVYLYICKYYEMEKVLDLFRRIYRPAYTQVRSLVKYRTSMKNYYQSLVLSLDNHKNLAVKYPLPVARRILREGDFSALHHYITELKKERDLAQSLSRLWRRSRAGSYSLSIIKKRLNRSQSQAGRRAVQHLKVVQKELKDFFSQEQFIRYEMLRNRRFFLKKKIAKKGIKGPSIEDFGRSFYIQNGYEYWPFKGEYWLDELGNYHYVGLESCK